MGYPGNELRPRKCQDLCTMKGISVSEYCFMWWPDEKPAQPCVLGVIFGGRKISSSGRNCMKKTPWFMFPL